MLSEALRLIRVFHDMKQVELAKELGVSKSYVSEIENGNRTPSLDVVNKYSELFGIPVSSIMFFSENLDGPEKANKAKNYISSKVIDFLKFIEKRSSENAIQQTK